MRVDSAACSGGDGEFFFELLFFSERGVIAVQGDEFVVGAEFDDAAFDEDGDLVGVAGGGDAVADEDGGAAEHLLPEAGEDLLFGVGVYTRQGIVQNQDAGVAEEGAGDGGALLLAAGEGDAALADDGLEAAGKVEDLGGDVSGAGGVLRSRARCVWATPRAMLSAMVEEKRKVSWGTKPMLARSWSRV